MNVQTLIVSPQEAKQKLDQYKRLLNSQRQAEDDQLEALYAAVKKGARVLNVGEAFKQTGLNEMGQPKLAIARADWRTVNFFPRRKLGRFAWETCEGGGGFSNREQWNPSARQLNLAVPKLTFAEDALTHNRLTSPVPHIPPSVRPRFKLSNYHILFEVERWDVYPVDPFLLRRIAGHMYIVEAEWDLTPLEAQLLSTLRAGH